MKGNVLFTQRVEIIESYGERRDCADQRIAEFIIGCGYIPVPVLNNHELANDIVDVLVPCGIVLTGGNSLVKYGGNAPERDSMDKELICLAMKKGIPLYGFCRGMQSILDFFGNKLMDVNGHVAVRHFIKGDEGEFVVNSYHNQACLELSNNNLKAVMKTEDGVIEMVRHSRLPIVGTMWHPEREEPFSDRDINRIKNLFG